MKVRSTAIRCIVALWILVLPGLAPAERPRPQPQPGRYRLHFLGAAGMVTGSMHVLEANGKRVLVDCGMKQGRARGINRRRHGPLPESALRADCMLLTHAHIDHSGRIPELVKQGFSGKIHCTKPTAALCRALLMDSARIQERNAKMKNRAHRRDPNWHPVEPLYTVRDVERALTKLETHPYGEQFAPTQGLRASFSNAGHILGASSVAVDLKINNQPKRILFSGDIGRRGSLLLKDPSPPPRADYVVMESTYGNRSHSSTADMKSQLLDVITRTQARGGKVIIPSFALGRTQQVVYLLNQLHRERKLSIPVFVDSPLSNKLTEVHRRNPQQLNSRVQQFVRRYGDPFSFSQLKMINTTEESKRLNSQRGPAVIIASAGMCTAGRVVHHLSHNIGDPNNTIAMVGYQGEGTLGRQIVQRQPVITIKDRPRHLRAEVKVLDAFSAHADKGELLQWASACGPQVKKFFLVHGDPDQTQALGAALTRQGKRVTIPTQDQVVDLAADAAAPARRPVPVGAYRPNRARAAHGSR